MLRRIATPGRYVGAEVHAVTPDAASARATVTCAPKDVPSASIAAPDTCPKRGTSISTTALAASFELGCELKLPPGTAASPSLGVTDAWGGVTLTATVMRTSGTNRTMPRP